MTDPTPPKERIRELLAERALFGLGEEELGELHTLTGGRPDEVDELALAAAALDLAHHNTAGQREQLPEHLHQRTLDAVRRAANEPAAKPVIAVAPLTPASLERQSGNGVRGRELLAWFTAAAALLAAAFLFSRQPTADGSSAEELRAELVELRERGDAEVVQVAWTPGDDPAAKGAGGEVVWSNELNRGVMVFRGLAANNAKENQYQLWIFDADRDAAHPVDGGVFDIPAGQKEVVVPIDPRVPVSRVTLFAVSVEKPGGVVVSDRARLPLTAAIE